MLEWGILISFFAIKVFNECNQADGEPRGHRVLPEWP